jgi:curved DNA-binding protein CbpA
MDAFDPWAILGVSPDADPATIKAAWRARAREFHPDRYASAGPADRERAAAHMTAVNVAYDELRRGRPRAGARRTATAADWPSHAAEAAGAAGAAGTAGDGGGPTASGTWFDDEVLAAALLRREQRHRRAARSRQLRLLVWVAALGLLALLFHLAMQRTTHYDVVVDADGQRYSDVDCGNGYDRGQSTAQALRDGAASSSDPAAALRKAEVVEAVCDQWSFLGPYVSVPAILLLVGAVWLSFFRRRR